MNTYTNGELAGIIVGCILAGILIGIVIGFFVSKTVFKKQLKKNPPITKETIRMIYTQTGRKPTEQQVNELYRRATKTK